MIVHLGSDPDLGGTVPVALPESSQLLVGDHGYPILAFPQWKMPYPYSTVGFSDDRGHEVNLHRQRLHVPADQADPGEELTSLKICRRKSTGYYCGSTLHFAVRYGRLLSVDFPLQTIEIQRKIQ